MGGRVMRLKVDDIVDASKAEAEKKINKLNALLAAAGRMDELIKSFTDKALQNKLMNEYSAQLP